MKPVAPDPEQFPPDMIDLADSRTCLRGDCVVAMIMSAFYGFLFGVIFVIVLRVIL
jgi:hypothetical protein